MTILSESTDIEGNRVTVKVRGDNQETSEIYEALVNELNSLKQMIELRHQMQKEETEFP